jgi:hypothetical protein
VKTNGLIERKGTRAAQLKEEEIEDCREDLQNSAEKEEVRYPEKRVPKIERGGMMEGTDKMPKEE